MEKANLICLPYAGGSRFAYKQFVEMAPSSLQIIPVDLPGRGTRFTEQLIYNPDKIIDDILKQIESYLEPPYAIYGHSMGTLLAYLLTKKITRSRLPLPLHLFLSGGKAPSTLEDEPILKVLDKQEFITQLIEIGGIPEKILNSPRLIKILKPILQADFQVIKNFNYQRTPPFNLPITLLLGTDENITTHQITDWQVETSKKVEVVWFPGGHFFLFDHTKEILELIARNLQLHQKPKSNIINFVPNQSMKSVAKVMY
ncbi:MAG: putative thioesterase [Thalassobius sp.]|nr:putative thioesterase [Thalassovita sp.]